jgi:phosphate-induced protein 1
MARSSAPILVATGALVASLATACSDTAVTSPTRPPTGAASMAQDPDILTGNARVLFHTREWQAADNAAHGNAKPGGSNTGIFYHGGPVLLTTSVVAIYWSSSTIYNGGPTPGASNCVDNSLVGLMLGHVGGSPYFNINTTYTDGSGNHIANAVGYTRCWANKTNAPSGSQTVSDAEMQSMILSGFSGGAISYDPNTLYAIFTGDAVNLGGGFGTQYCAYHGWFTTVINGVSRVVKYAAMPYDFAFPASCSMFGGVNALIPPNGDAGADAEVNTLAHETEETTTDPEGSAWFDRRGRENADKCAWTFGTTYGTSNGGTANMSLGGKNFLIQQNWVNAGSGGCAVSYP